MEIPKLAFPTDSLYKKDIKMITYETLFTFIFTSIIACLIPGPAIIFVISKTIKNGLKSGFQAVWGLQIGFAIQVIAAACGLSALIIKSYLLFTILKYVGAIYLIYLGVSILLKNEKELNNKVSFISKEHSPSVEGILINLVNPKITIFFISYIPQFININSNSPIKQLLVFGLLFCIVGTITTIGYAITANQIACKWSRPKFGTFIKKWVPGIIFLGFGLKLAIAEK